MLFFAYLFHSSDDRVGGFIKENELAIDHNQEAYFPGIASNRWLAIRLEFLGNCIILFASLFAVLDHNISAGMIGLSLSYAMSVTQVM